MMAVSPWASGAARTVCVTPRDPHFTHGPHKINGINCGVGELENQQPEETARQGASLTDGLPIGSRPASLV